MSTRIDRRVVRTRQLLRAALLALIRERGFDVLTEQEIADRATLNRATFYLHYVDKYDLLRQVITETLDELATMRPPSSAQHPDVAERLRQFFVSLFSHVVNNAEFYRVTVGAAGIAVAANEIYENTFRVGIRWLNRAGIKSWRVPPDVMISVLCGAYMGMVRWAVHQPTMPSPEVMANRFMELVLPGILSAVSE